MERVTRDKVCYRMSASNPPALRVEPGETFCVEMEDCYSGALQSPTDVFTKEMWDTVNPATGPVYIAGAAPGDVLCVEVLALRTRPWAVMCVEHGAGALGDRVEGVETVILPIRDHRLYLREDFSLPLRPMIGVIGVAPAGEPILNGTPGEHGGNMDCKEITAGAKVYLPVSAEGALLAVGDVHAVMGDGEVCICGAEVAGEADLRADVLKTDLPTPCVETDEWLYFIASAKTLDECEGLVLAKAHAYLTRGLGLAPNDAARVMSLVGELQVCQVVDPLKTLRFAFPKDFLRTYTGREALIP